MGILGTVIVSYVVFVILFGLHHYTDCAPASYLYLILEHASLYPLNNWPAIQVLLEKLQEHAMMMYDALQKFILETKIKFVYRIL